jgi:hypothetical protein
VEPKAAAAPTRPNIPSDGSDEAVRHFKSVTNTRNKTDTVVPIKPKTGAMRRCGVNEWVVFDSAMPRIALKTAGTTPKTYE